MRNSDILIAAGGFLLAGGLIAKAMGGSGPHDHRYVLSEVSGCRSGLPKISQGPT